MAQSTTKYDLKTAVLIRCSRAVVCILERLILIRLYKNYYNSNTIDSHSDKIYTAI